MLCNPELYESFVNITPSPVLPRLKRLDNRMRRCMEVFSSVFVSRGVATADVTADQAFA